MFGKNKVKKRGSKIWINGQILYVDIPPEEVKQVCKAIGLRWVSFIGQNGNSFSVNPNSVDLITEHLY